MTDRYEKLVAQGLIIWRDKPNGEVEVLKSDGTWETPRKPGSLEDTGPTSKTTNAMTTAKTSETHPLEIQWVSPATVPGRIGLTFCPGKKQPYAMTGVWDRDVATDLDAISAWGATALVCLIEAHELTELKVNDLPTKTRARGLGFFHLPIADMDVPDAEFEHLWTYAGERLREILERGEHIVVFCKGGLGRTGTIAARLLIELGEAPVSAINAVRAARPGAIENAEQERYVRAVLPGSPATWRRRALGCVLGGAVGDGFGYAVEFSQLDRIFAQHGPEGLQEPVLEAEQLIVSDDTQMTLFTLEGLLDALNAGKTDIPSIVARIRLAYFDWLITQRGEDVAHEPVGSLVFEPELNAQRAPGNTCLSALEDGGWGTPEKPQNDSKGCGGVMRVPPIGLITQFDAATAFELGARAAAITHTHPTGYLAAGHLAATIRELVDGVPLEEAATRSLALLHPWPDHEETEDAVQRAITLAQTRSGAHTKAVASLGEGWIAEEALAIGLYAALVGENFPDVLRIAANHDGDSDSTASIAGQLYGAWRGITSLPNDWVMSLDVLSPTMVLMSRLPERKETARHLSN